MKKNHFAKRKRKRSKETLFTISLKNLVMGSLLFVGFVNANAQCNARPMPYTDDFSNTSLNACTPTAGGWDTIGAPSTGAGWYISNSNNAGGTSPEIEAYGNQANGGVSQTMRLISPPVKTLGISTATLSFKHTLGLTNSGASGSGVITIKVESSPDKTTWTSLYSTTYNATSSLTYVVTETRTVTLNGLSSDSTFVRFSISGVLFKVNNWDIDNVNFTSPTTSVSLFNAAKELTAYPNPVSGFLTVNNVGKRSVSLTDVIGK
ncbi:MAG: hypothetical protein ACXVC6_15620, partial [Bacteroidia bacterium]